MSDPDPDSVPADPDDYPEDLLQPPAAQEGAPGRVKPDYAIRRRQPRFPHLTLIAWKFRELPRFLDIPLLCAMSKTPAEDPRIS